ncbi:hypothetical protein ACEWY4_006394 [Coilia grayii]|uniref:PWWP domain-containing protein n=1 Tax=Coilia grayii TaxID=363190 RepID=A0ABD1KDJ7_9TELE
MTSSDGFYSPPLWKITDNSTVSSSDASLSSGNNQASQFPTAGQQVQKSSSWNEVPEGLSAEQPITDTQHGFPPYAYLQQTEAVIHHAQDSRIAPSQEHGYVSISSDNTTLELQDRPPSDGLPIHHTADKALSLETVMTAGLSQQTHLASGNITEDLTAHGSVLEHDTFVMFLSEAGMDGETVQPVLYQVTAVESAEEGSQEPLVSSAGESCLEVAVQNVGEATTVDTSPPYLEKWECTEPLPVQKIADLNRACPDSEPLTKYETHTDFLVVSEATDMSAKENPNCRESSHRPQQHLQTSTDSPESEGAPRTLESLKRASSTIFAPDSPQQYCPGLLQTSNPTFSPVGAGGDDLLDRGLTTVDSERDCDNPVSTFSPSEKFVEVPEKNVFLQQVRAEGCCIQDTLQAPWSPSSHVEHNYEPTSSDNTTVDLQDGPATGSSPRNCTANKTLNLHPVIADGFSPQSLQGPGNITENSENLAEHGMLDNEKSALSSGETGTDSEALQPVLCEGTAVDSLEEYMQKPPSSAGESPTEVAVQNVCENKTVHGSLAHLEKENIQPLSLSEGENLNGPCPDVEPLTKYKIDSVVALGTTDSTDIENTNCKESSKKHQEHFQSATHTQPVVQQASNPTSSPAGDGHGKSLLLSHDAGVETGAVTSVTPFPEPNYRAESSEDTTLELQDALVSGSSPMHHTAAELNRSCSDGEPSTHDETYTGSLLASEPTDTSIKDDPNCKQSSQSRVHFQTSTYLPESEGVPYSFRRKRRWGPGTSFVTSSPKQSQPVVQQPSNPTSSPVGNGHGESTLLSHDAGMETGAVTPVPAEVTIAEAVTCHGQDLHTAGAQDSPGSPSLSTEPARDDPICMESSQSRVHFQTSTYLPESEGVPYSFRRKRRWGPGTSFVTSSPKQRQPVVQQPSNPTSSPVGNGHGESTLLSHDAGMETGAVTPVPAKVTIANSETDCDNTLSTSGGEDIVERTEQNVCSRHAEAVICHAQDSHTATAQDGPGSPSPSTELARDDPICMESSQSHLHFQTSTYLPESEGVPYSFRRKRRWGPGTSFVTPSPKRRQPAVQQPSNPTSSPVEDSSQETLAAHAVPVKRKRGRPEKTAHLIHVDKMPAKEGSSKPAVVCESAMPDDKQMETPDVSLVSKCCHTREAATTSAAAMAAGDEADGRECASSPPVPPPASAAPLQSESEELDLPTSSSPDISIEQILQDDPMPLTPLSLPEEEGEEEEDPEEDEELPSFLERKPFCITEGLCVWCKFRKYPFWPAVVKSVNHKNKKASIVFIDAFLLDENRVRKGLTVSLKTLKPFNCEDAEELAEQAKQQYGDAVTWCLDLIYDYRIRIGCGSFSGSFIEYFANDVSCPLRRKYSQGTSDLTFPTHLIVDDLCYSSEEEGAGDQVNEYPHKKLLPDRSKAARNRANEKLVDFIVRKRGAEKRLLVRGITQ